MRPRPKGQIPAMARNSTVLPAPEGPVINTRSPADTVAFTPSIKVSPVAVCSRTSVSRSAALALRTTWMRDLFEVPVGRFHHLAEGRQAFDVGAPARDLLVGIDEPVERSRHLAVCDADLHHRTERDQAGEKAGRRDQQRHRVVRLADHAGEDGQAALRNDELPPVAHHVGEAGQSAAALERIAARECHHLDVVAKAHQPVAKIRLVAQPFDVQRHEPASDHVGQPGRQGGNRAG